MVPLMWQLLQYITRAKGWSNIKAPQKIQLKEIFEKNILEIIFTSANLCDGAPAPEHQQGKGLVVLGRMEKLNIRFDWKGHFSKTLKKKIASSARSWSDNSLSISLLQ